MGSISELPYHTYTSLQDEARENVGKVIRGLNETLVVHDYIGGIKILNQLNACLDQKIAISEHDRQQICLLLWKTFQQPDLSLHIQTKVANVLSRILKQVFLIYQKKVHLIMSQRNIKLFPN